MRIRQLSLLRYGKFTDRVLEFPAARRDFHLVVGPNEAGKSTTRHAILDLLYGIETRSSFDFVHAKAEMRLAATLEHAGATLAFIRVKARLKNLLGPDERPLPDAALAAFLGGTDRAFFDQMFGLDHARLEAGGKSILSASNDIGQILFQSAAGIASLGQVRDQLAQEADGLWARRKSVDRAYYRAGDELAQADAALKAATVRTKDWVTARERVEMLEDRRTALRQAHAALEAERLRLERIRRVGPALRHWHELQAELAPLADAVLLPLEAARRLAEAELEQATAGRDAELHLSQAQRLREQLQAVQVDQRLLQHEAEVRALAERRQQTRHHGRDIERRQQEVAALWQQVEAALRQLGWPAACEADLRLKLPPLPARSLLADLAKRFAVLDQARSTSRAALAEKAAELEAIGLQLQGLAVKAVPPGLRGALTVARALGNVRSASARDQHRVAQCEREFALALAALGAWCAPVAVLRTMTLPPMQEVGLRLVQRADAAAARQALLDKAADLDATIRAQQLETAQYRKLHHPVTLAELGEARAARDRVWHAIRTGAQPLDQAAPHFETRLEAADQVADERHAKAQAVSELQARLDALERAALQAADNAERLQALDAQLAQADADWARITESLGLPGLPLSGLEAWRAARARLLLADDALVDARQGADAGLAAVREVTDELAAALQAAGVAVDAGSTFESLLMLATDTVDGAAAVQARIDELGKQREQAGAGMRRLDDKVSTAQAAWEAWSSAWRAALAAAALPEGSSVASAEGYMSVLAEIDDKLGRMREIRAARIDAMQRDLADFEQDLEALKKQVAPDLAGLAPADAVIELSERLSRALDARKERERLARELAECELQARTAGDRVARAQAGLAPLMTLAQADSAAALHALIALSDRRRQLEAAALAAWAQVQDGSDGLSLAALEAEIAATDLAGIAAQMADIAARLESLRAENDGVTAELTGANAALAGIAGQDDAARAESLRQDALAKMANAAERYIRVHTASRLLKWAIDRYRETRQGPMLKRAGEVFSALTLGSFQRLSVDFDHEPMSLHGQRADGELVGLAGMSDGTRDQLYLALRLAALELHLDQGHALPFIADDLFINYDDPRARAGLQALAHLSEKTQVIFLSHHDHLVASAREVFGPALNLVKL